jgi:hypothetical protein
VNRERDNTISLLPPADAIAYICDDPREFMTHDAAGHQSQTILGGMKIAPADTAILHLK